MDISMEELKKALSEVLGDGSHCVFSKTEIRYLQNSAETTGILKKAMLKMFVGAIIGGSVGGGVITWAMKSFAGG